MNEIGYEGLLGVSSVSEKGIKCAEISTELE